MTRARRQRESERKKGEEKKEKLVEVDESLKLREIVWRTNRENSETGRRRVSESEGQ